MNNNATTPIETNRELELARRIIENTGVNLFLTGRAGTGKTTFLKNLRETSSKRMVVVAPTGIAAINAGGVTIHSFFQLDFGPFIPGSIRKSNANERFSREKLKIMRGMDLLVIDEISMVRSDLLEQIDDVLRRKRDRRKPFGGVQLLMIGDPQQLPPVVTDNERPLLSQHYRSPWFFDSPALNTAGYISIELQHVYRQSQGRFLDLLNAIRDNRCTPQILAEINARYNPSFVPPKDTPYVRLTTHNATARAINQAEMDSLQSPAYTFSAMVNGNFPETAFPADGDLSLKKGAQVMFIKNDSSGEHKYYNGMLGEITEISDNSIWVRASDNGEIISVNTEEWTNNRYEINEETREITEVVDGTFLQYPLRPAWAITIHKSQGLTFEHAIIDSANSFAHGQTYVALSRCKTLEGLVLSAPITADAIICDPRVVEFLSNSTTPSAEILNSLEHRYFIDMLEDLFTFSEIDDQYFMMSSICSDYFANQHPEIVERLSEIGMDFIKNIRDVATRFRPVFYNLASGSDYMCNTALNERVTSGATYFVTQLDNFVVAMTKIKGEIANKQVKKRVNDARQRLEDAIRVKKSALEVVIAGGFSPSLYLEAKGSATLGEKKKQKKPKKEKKEPALPKDVDVVNHAAYLSLSEWRIAEATRLKVPAYVIATNRALAALANMMPRTLQELNEVPYLTQNIAKRYGEAILEILKPY